MTFEALLSFFVTKAALEEVRTHRREQLPAKPRLTTARSRVRPATMVRRGVVQQRPARWTRGSARLSLAGRLGQLRQFDGEDHERARQMRRASF